MKANKLVINSQAKYIVYIEEYIVFGFFSACLGSMWNNSWRELELSLYIL